MGLAAKYPDDGGRFAAAAAAGEEIATAYDACDYNRAMRAIMALADQANKYVEEREPWNLRKDPAHAAELQEVCTVALNLFRQLVVYLAPVLPSLARQTAALLNQPIQRWDEAQTPLVGAKVSRFEHLMKRVEPAQVEAMTQASREEAPVEKMPRVQHRPRPRRRRSPQKARCPSMAPNHWPLSPWRRRSTSMNSARSTCAWRVLSRRRK